MTLIRHTRVRFVSVVLSIILSVITIIGPNIASAGNDPLLVFAAASLRETLEEAGARVEMQALYTLMNVPHVHQVHLFYRARLLDLNFWAGTESLEVGLFSEADIPWEEIAFPTVSKTLKLFFADLASHRSGSPFGFHSLDIHRQMRSS